MSRGGVQGFEKDRLRQALAVRRLSQIQIAALLGVSTSAIYKWKAGGCAPERVNLDNLAKLLNVKPEWFTRKPSQALQGTRFRSNASALASGREMLVSRLEWAQDLAELLSEFVDFPEVNLPQLNFATADEITDEDIESAAKACRKLWKLGGVPIADLALAVEGAGVILVREVTGLPTIEGASGWSLTLDRPFILLSADKSNGFRSRFDLAHELAHLVLHRHIPESTSRAQYKQMELQAHKFAGALLLPEEGFASELRMPVTLEDLLLLKSRWGVSAAAIAMRLRNLGIIDEEARTRLFKQRSVRWGAHSEPGDKDRIPELPRLLRRTLDLVTESNLVPLASVEDLVGTSPRDVEQLAGLPEGYLAGPSAAEPLVSLRPAVLAFRPRT